MSYTTTISNPSSALEVPNFALPSLQNSLLPTDTGQSDAIAPSVSDVIGFDVHTLSPDALMLYLDTRLRAIDEQIDGIFTKQQKDEKLRKALLEMQKIVDPLDENPNHPNQVLKMPDYEGGRTETEQRLHEQIAIIATVDPALAEQLETDLAKEGQILYIEDGKYKGSEVGNTKDYLASTCKQLEAGSQLAMIQLQSLMSARQTAIQLSSNLIASYNDSQKAVVGNIR